MTDEDFFVTTMPASRPADYYIGYMGGSIFLDFDNVGQNNICLKRISFDGYGSCGLMDGAIPLNESDSIIFRNMVQDGITDQDIFKKIVKKAIELNKPLIWADALEYYELT